MKNLWDAIVVGAGPAGSVAAMELARAGHAVLMVDKANFPRSKVCGCCLNQYALSTLEHIGLGVLPQRLGAVPLHSVRLVSGGTAVTLSLPGGVSLSRESLDSALIEEAIRRGVRFRPGEQAIMLGATEDGRMIRLKGEHHEEIVQGKVILVADGLNGRVAARADGFAIETDRNARIGAGVTVARASHWFAMGVVYMAVAEGGYVGLVRLEDGRLDLGAALDAAFVRRAGSLGKAVQRILAANGWEIADLEKAPWKGTPALTRTPARIAGERWLALGDSCGYVEPFTGEGMALAMASAVAAAPIASRAIRSWHIEHAVTWKRRHRQLVERRRLVCRGITRLLRYPWLCSTAVRALIWMPLLASPVLHWLNARHSFSRMAKT